MSVLGSIEVFFILCAENETFLKRLFVLNQQLSTPALMTQLMHVKLMHVTLHFSSHSNWSSADWGLLTSSYEIN